MFVSFICITETGPGLGRAGSNLIYNDVQMSRIASIYDAHCKKVTELIYDS
jgi:hypothetical protein